MMMVEEINKSVKQNRNWAVLGIGVGVVLLVAYFGYQVVMAVEQPTIRDTKPKVVVAYVSNPRGLRSLTKIEQRKFLEEWRDYLMSDDAAQAALNAHLKDLDDEARKQFVDQMVLQFKDIVVDDAEQFERLRGEERARFAQRRAEELDGQKSFIRDLGKVFGKDIGSQDDIRAMLFEITTPKERNLCIPYLEAMQRVAEQLEKQRRAQPAPDKA